MYEEENNCACIAMGTDILLSNSPKWFNRSFLCEVWLSGMTFQIQEISEAVDIFFFFSNEQRINTADSYNTNVVTMFSLSFIGVFASIFLVLLLKTMIF